MTEIPKDIENKILTAIYKIEEAAASDGYACDSFSNLTKICRLARIAGMSERNLTKWFKTYTGKTIAAYASERRSEYAARILRLFPETSKAEVARIAGFAYPNALYGFMRRQGVESIDSLRTSHSDKYAPLPFRLDYLPDCTMFLKQNDVVYDDCGKKDFEVDNWDYIEAYVRSKYPSSVIKGYFGIAIDRFIKLNPEAGIFISGIIYNKIPDDILRPAIGDIGVRQLASRKYAVFTHKGAYSDLSDFYNRIVSTLRQAKDIQADIATPFMEKYLNSPSDTTSNNLITELWIPLQY